MKPAPPFTVLVLVTLSGTMALHTVLPALPDTAHALNVEAANLQLVISLYLAGLAAGQLVWGPLSDAHGRRPMLLAGLALYTAGGIAAACALNLPMLLAARFLQAVGGCAGLALGRAMVRDTNTAQDAIGRLASLNLAISIGPALAPMVGGALTAHFGWRWVFAALSLAGALTLWLSWKAVPETGSPSGRVDMRTLLRDARELLANRQFAALAIGGGIFTTALWGFLTALPFIMTRQLGQTVQVMGVCAAITVVGAGTGNAITSRLVRRVPGDRLLATGVAISLSAALVLHALVLSHRLSTVWLVATVTVFTCGTGIVNPVAVTRGISVVPRLTGSASGTYGFLQMSIGALMTTISTLGSDLALTASLVLMGAAALSGVCFRIANAAGGRDGDA